MGLGWGQEFRSGLEGEGVLQTRNLGGLLIGTETGACGGEPGGRELRRHRWGPLGEPPRVRPQHPYFLLPSPNPSLFLP